MPKINGRKPKISKIAQEQAYIQLNQAHEILSTIRNNAFSITKIIQNLPHLQLPDLRYFPSIPISTLQKQDSYKPVISKSQAKRELLEAIKFLEIVGKERDFLIQLADFKRHNTKEFKTGNVPQLKLSLKKKLARTRWRILDAKGNGYNRGFYQLINLTYKIAP